jgi:hypothetical protein
MSNIANGVDVDKLVEIINTMKADPNRANVEFKARLNGLTVHILKLRSGILHWREMNRPPTLEAIEFPTP